MGDDIRLLKCYPGDWQVALIITLKLYSKISQTLSQVLTQAIVRLTHHHFETLNQNFQTLSQMLTVAIDRWAEHLSETLNQTL